MPKPAKTRMCLMCRENFEKEDLLRFVIDPSNNLLLDIYGKAPARGNYICKDEKCLAKAIDKQVLLKMLKVNKTEDFKSSVLKSLLFKISGDLKMLKKAQLFVPGADQVSDLVKANKAEFVLFAEDISQGSENKIISSLERNNIANIKLLNKQQLSELVGIANCSVLAFKRSKLTLSLKNILQTYKKLQKTQ